MLAALEQLLILQDRDRKIGYVRAELAGVQPQRELIRSRASQTHSASEAAKLKLRHLESERKKLELEAEAKRQQIERYSLQQYQTKKNEEYRALTHEIDMAREAIRKLEDQQLELMEQAEAVQVQAIAAAKAAQAAQGESDRQLADLAAREANLKAELAKLEADRGALVAAVDTKVLPRYEGLRRNKGDRVVVGIDHAACGGCHMKLPPQVLVTCQGEAELAMCPNCGRILYYTRDMSLAPAE
jgi:hypothetical protein